MKVMQLNSCFRRGSTGKITGYIHDFLINNNNIALVCWERKGKVIEKDTYKLANNELIAKAIVLKNRIYGLQYKGSFLYTRKLIKIIKKEKPDIVHIHCINAGIINIYKLLKYLGENNISTVITLHAEFFYTGSCGHSYECNQWKKGCIKCKQGFSATHSYIFDRTKTAWEKMEKSIRHLDKTHTSIVAVSPWVKQRAEQSDIINHLKIETILNPIDNNAFKPNINSKIEKFKLERKIPLGKKIVFHATASFNPYSTTFKGGNHIIKLAEDLREEDIVIVVAAINANIMGSLPENIIYIGKISDESELSLAYSSANLSLIVSERETFSMVCAESLMCGTPVVGFKAGGPETISLPEFSCFVDYPNIQELSKAVKNMIDKKNPSTANEVSNEAIKRFSINNIGEKYVEVYKRILKK